MKTITLREGKERALQRRRPWILDNAIAKGGGDRGETKAYAEGIRVASALVDMR
jgi:PUA-like domain